MRMQSEREISERFQYIFLNNARNAKADLAISNFN